MRGSDCGASRLSAHGALGGTHKAIRRLSHRGGGNPWHNAQRQFDQAAELIHLEPGLRAVLRDVKRQLIVSFPVKMDDGSVRVFEGYRV
ncbi:MAG: hypothetical protein WCB51_10925 [Candidatus Dormiibacterota bacterium]